MKYWFVVDEMNDAFDCDVCDAMVHRPYDYCPKCGDKKEIVALIDVDLTLKKYRELYENDTESNKKACRS